MGILQEPCAEGIRYSGQLIAKNTGQKPHHAVDNHHGRQLSPCQHVVPDRELIGDQMLPDPFVIAFIMAADEDQMLLP
ncbi:hypothetical protein D3C75_766390 [compost metagenome]